MRPLMLLVAVIVLCALGPPSWAYYNPFEGYGGSKVSLHLSNYDVGTQYFNLADGTYTATQLAALATKTAYDPLTTTPYRILPVGAAAGEDTWGIFRLDQIWALDSNWNQVAKIWETADATGEWEITAIFWGEDDQGLYQVTNGLTQQISQTIWGDNMHAAFFANQVTLGVDDFTTVWKNGPESTTNPSYTRPGDNPEYIGVTDSPGSTDWTKTGAISAIPLWTFDTVYGTNLYIPDSKAEFVNTFNPASPPGTISGSGSAYAIASEVPYWGTGAGNWQWQSNPWGDLINPHDITLAFSAAGKYDDPSTPTVDESQPGNGWLVSSSDPLKGGVTPELSSASLMLLGLFPLGLLGWKRRKE